MLKKEVNGICGKNHDSATCLQNYFKVSENRSPTNSKHKILPKLRVDKKSLVKKYIHMQCNLRFKDHVILSRNKNGLHMEKLKSYANCLLKLPTTESENKPLLRQKRTKFKCDVCQDSEIFNKHGFKRHSKLYHLKNINDGWVYKTSSNLFKCNSAHAKYMKNKLRRKKKLYPVKVFNHLMNVSRRLKETDWIRTMNVTTIKCELCVEQKDLRGLIQYIQYLMNNHEIQNHFLSSTNLQKLSALK